MSLGIYSNPETMGAAAAAYGAEKIRAAIAKKGLVNIIVATGASQFAMLKNLAQAPGIDWGKVAIFHLDEYVGLPETHPASFRKYIKTRFVAKLPVVLAAAYYVDGSNPDPQAVCNELGEILAKHPIDVCFIGIGENGHIAFNDPPADFDTAKAYLVVNLDEYVGLPETHPASFRKYIKTRFVAKLPIAPAAAYYVDGSNPDSQAACNELGAIIAKHPIDVCFIGIGENGHIAFNDPPADFDTEKAYLVVNLDEACRKQQFGEGWFSVFDDVPKQAISMSVRQIMQSRAIVNTVPDVRKAYAMQITFEGELSPMHPASVIRLHADAATFCDVSAASKLSAFTRSICAK